MLANVKIEDTGFGTCRVFIDSEDISDRISEVTYHHKAGEEPTVTITLVPQDASISMKNVRIKAIDDLIHAD